VVVGHVFVVVETFSKRPKAEFVKENLPSSALVDDSKLFLRVFDFNSPFFQVDDALLEFFQIDSIVITRVNVVKCSIQFHKPPHVDQKHSKLAPVYEILFFPLIWGVRGSCDFVCHFDCGLHEENFFPNVALNAELDFSQTERAVTALIHRRKKSFSLLFLLWGHPDRQFFGVHVEVNIFRFLLLPLFLLFWRCFLNKNIQRRAVVGTFWKRFF